MTRPGPIHELLAGTAEYPFVALERRARELAPSGVRPIHFGMGDPREETPEFIRRALREAVPAVSSYPTVVGRPELREACARWLARRFGVEVDPERHLLPANGTKEAVFLLAQAIVGSSPERRTVVIPSPAYPVYETGARFARADVHFVPLRSQDGWRFDAARVPDEVWSKTALLWLNYPHNPTGAVGRPADYQAALDRARHFGFWVAADEAYADLFFGEPPRSALEFGLDNVIALHTLSKRSAMTGYRSGFMAGDERLIDALRRFRPHVGVATPDFVQQAAIVAWNDDHHAGDQRRCYAAKRARLLDDFARRGWQIEASEATFYLWMKAPEASDVAFAERLMRLGIVAMPGSLLGPGGEGYVRWALVPTLEECDEALRRMSAIGDRVAS